MDVPANPTLPVLRVNRLAGEQGVPILLVSPITFLDPAHRAALATELSIGVAGSFPSVQRQYLGAGESLAIGDEECLIVAGSFRNDGTITFSGSGFIHFI